MAAAGWIDIAMSARIAAAPHAAGERQAQQRRPSTPAHHMILSGVRLRNAIRSGGQDAGLFAQGWAAFAPGIDPSSS